MAGLTAERADVLVVGGGVAGACAAVAAAEAGAQVLLLERGRATGGTTALAAGHFYLGGGTPVQAATGFADSPQAMIDYLTTVGVDPAVEKIRRYCEDSVAHFHWLEAHGVLFERSFYSGKSVVQPGTEGLMWTGNEKVWPYRDLSAPAPRGHKIAAPAERGGRLLVRVLADALRAAGVTVRCESTVTALRTDDSGRVTGADYRHADSAAQVDAGAVVLAAGGFVMNPDLLAAHAPRLAANAIPLGTPTDDGTAITLGRAAGGAFAHMDGMFLTASFYPPADLLKGIIVNADGRRFVAEDSYHGRTAGAVLDQPDAVAYLIVDAATMARPHLAMVEFAGEWPTVADMEAALGIPTGNLQRTLRDYNSAAACGDDLHLHKHPEWVTPLDTSPWSAFNLTPGRASYVGFTLGGLRTTVDGQVRRADGDVVAGLYAAGACASNIATDSAGYASGICLGEGSYFGRRAGTHAARATATTKG